MIDIIKKFFRVILGVSLGVSIFFGAIFALMLPLAIDEFPGFFLILFSIFVLFSILIYSLPSLIGYMIDIRIEKLDVKLQDIRLESIDSQDFEEILNITKKGYTALRIAKVLKICQFVTGSNWIKEKIFLYHTYVELTFLSILKNLKTQLHEKMNYHKNLLKQEKIKLAGIDEEKNSDINPRFKMVEVRLDKQIEQFEELQRVLVKM